MALTYEESGVSVARGEALVDVIKALAASTHGDDVLQGIGGYAGLLRLPGTQLLLAASADGVGTKLELAFASGVHNTVGIDLVAMCVNDLVCVGAEPVAFLDYAATGRLAPERMAAVIEGIAAGCRDSGCALLGGETAEMPGFYPDDTYDLAGFAIGLVQPGQLIDGARVRAGDVVVGLPSAGIHSNGFSLVRRVFGEEIGARARELLTPTRLYVRPVIDAHRALEGGLRSACHVTGGGLIGRVHRQLPDGLAILLRAGSWQLPELFSEIRRRGPVEPAEMLRTFNCGIGMSLIVGPDQVDALRLAVGAEREEDAPVIGQVVTRETDGPKVRLEGDVFDA